MPACSALEWESSWMREFAVERERGERELGF